MTKRELFLANARGEWTERTPIWIMRQAGRYMEEYRKMREKYSFEKICQTPDLAAEVTFQPIEKFGFDAAIIFSDILFILEPFGIDLKYDPSPKLSPLLESPKQVSLYKDYDPAEKLGFVAEAIRLTREKIGNDVALLGFCGAPFTLFCYLCGSTGYIGINNGVRFLTRYPKEGAAVLELTAELSYKYLKMQLEAGADAVQLFDTWAGELPKDDFDRWAGPYLKSIVERLHRDGHLTSIYIRGTYHLLESIREIGSDIVSIDWKTSMAAAADILKPAALQGNLSPHLMLGAKDNVLARASLIMEKMNSYEGYIFNLGHGILPETPVENVSALVELVHGFRRTKDD